MALEVKLSLTSTEVVTDDKVRVLLRPYYPYRRADGSCCRLVAADVTYPFKVEAVSPRGVTSRISMRRTGNRFVWSGSLLVDQAGVWEVRAANWGPRYTRAAGGRPRIRFPVRQI